MATELLLLLVVLLVIVYEVVARIGWQRTLSAMGTHIGHLLPPRAVGCAMLGALLSACAAPDDPLDGVPRDQGSVYMLDIGGLNQQYLEQGIVLADTLRVGHWVRLREGDTVIEGRIYSVTGDTLVLVEAEERIEITYNPIIDGP